MRFLAGTDADAKCRADSCATQGYSCDCIGTEMCTVRSCGAWRPTDAAASLELGSNFRCSYHDANSGQQAKCVELAPTPSPTPSPLSCPIGSSPFLIYESVTDAATKASPQVTNYAPGTLSMYFQGMGGCQVGSVDKFINGPYSNIATLGNPNRHCASADASSTTFESYLMTVLESSGFAFRPTFEMFDIDFVSNRVPDPNHPRDTITVVGLLNGQVVLPTIIIQPATVDMEINPFTFPAAGMVELGGPNADVPVQAVQMSLNSQSSCTTGGYERCTARVVFNSMIDRMAIIQSQVFDAGVNPIPDAIAIQVKEIELCSIPTPSPTPIACPAGSDPLKLYEVLDKDSTSAAKMVTTYGPTETLSTYMYNTGGCVLESVTQVTGGDDTQIKMAEDANGACAFVPSAPLTIGTAVYTIFETSGFAIRPKFNVYDVDFARDGQGYTKRPRDLVAVFGFYNGLLVTPEVDIGPNGVSMEIVFFTVSAADMAAIGEPLGNTFVRAMQMRTDSLASCDAATKDSCTFNVQFLGPINKLVIVSTQTYIDPRSGPSDYNTIITPMDLCSN